MAEENFQERTEEATPRRIEEARRRGQVPKSRELPSVFILITAIIIFFFGNTFLFQKNAEIFSYLFQISCTTRLTEANVTTLFYTIATKFFIILLPFLLAAIIVSILANILQFGVIFSLDPVTPNLAKINPIEGFKRLFSLQSLVEFIKALLKVIIVAVITYFAIISEVDSILPLTDMAPGQILIFTAETTFSILWKSSIALLFLSLIDYLYQRWEFLRNLRMTRQELKEEFKETEGDPLVKSRIRQIQREMSRKRMMAEVPKADVVITNPIHLAIALKYEKDKMNAPQVIAKGKDNLAQKIKEIAEKHKVPVVENVELAHILYKLDIGSFITPDMYQAVAEVLAYVYALKNRGKLS